MASTYNLRDSHCPRLHAAGRPDSIGWTAALDSETESRLVQLLTQLKTGPTSLPISHRFSTVKLADWIVVMENGRVSECGRHAQLMAAEKLYYRMYTAQADLFYRQDTVQVPVSGYAPVG
jgi:ABC-type glutathione transport system ATPase component